MIKEELNSFIENELKEMLENIKSNLEKNVTERKFNVFHVFAEDSVLERYMALGRSFDSQLGTRLQRVAFFLARKKFGLNATPNYVFLAEENDTITLRSISIPENDLVDTFSTQKVFLIQNEENYISTINKIIDKFVEAYKENNKLNYKLKDNKDKVNKYKEQLKNDIAGWENKSQNYKKPSDYALPQKTNSVPIPIDLLYIFDDKAYTYEIKSGGNLDTKNQKSNAKEVADLLELFSFFPNNFSFFATCYNNNGEAEGMEHVNEGILYRGNYPNGSIFKIFQKEDYAYMRNRILVGSKFWEQILPDSITYKEFIEIYRTVFTELKIEGKLKNA